MIATTLASAENFTNLGNLGSDVKFGEKITVRYIVKNHCKIKDQQDVIKHAKVLEFNIFIFFGHTVGQQLQQKS